MGRTVNQQANLDGLSRPWPTELTAQRHVSVVRSALAPLTVVLADTQPAIRHGVRFVLESSADMAIVDEAATADEVIEQTSRHRPNVLVLDLHTGQPAGINLISHVLRCSPDTGVLVFSAVDDDKSITSAIHAGARGYLLKSAGPDQLRRGIEVVAAGEAIVGKSIAGRFGALVRPWSVPAPYPFPQLTNRERDVLERVAAGRSNLAIARELALAPKTISNRVSAVFSKLGVADRSQAIILARDAGLGRT
jgi:DNA-binding NarL/FixJ family response regulator